MKKLKVKKLSSLKEFVLSRDQTKKVKGGLDPELGTIISGNGF